VKAHVAPEPAECQGGRSCGHGTILACSEDFLLLHDQAVFQIGFFLV
jgi:hypothetical protein